MPGGVGGLGREPHPTRLTQDFNPGARVWLFTRHLKKNLVIIRNYGLYFRFLYLVK